MEPIRPRTEPNYAGVLIDLPRLRARMAEVMGLLQSEKKHCRRTQQTTMRQVVNTVGVPWTEVATAESIDWTHLLALKAEATALCMLRAAMRGKVHAQRTYEPLTDNIRETFRVVHGADIDARSVGYPALRSVILFACGHKPPRVWTTAKTNTAETYRADILRCMAQRFKLEPAGVRARLLAKSA